MITISLTSPVPLQDQLVAELRRLLATGKLSIGDELPPVRQLANDLGINLNTVARAYRELTDAGLLASMRGRGTVVVGTRERPRGKPNEERKRIEQALGAALADAKIAGFSESETRSLVERQMERIW
jgi:GntR family transcriptional regulator